MFTLTIGQFRENHFSYQRMVSGTDQYCDAIGQEVGEGNVNFDHWSVKYAEEEILLN